MGALLDLALKVDAGPASEVARLSMAEQVMEKRRQRVVAELQAHPMQRIAVNVEDVPLLPEPGKPVSIVLAVRTAHGIVSAEMLAPRDRFDAAVFHQILQQQGAAH